MIFFKKTIFLILAMEISFLLGYQCKHEKLKENLHRKELKIEQEWEQWYKKQIHTAENCEIACPKYLKKYKETICIYGSEK